MQSIKQKIKNYQKNGAGYIITYGVSFIALGLAMAALGPLLPSLADHIDVSLANVSFLFTASSLGYLTGSAGGGRLYDRYKGHTLMKIALILMIGMCVLIPFFTEYLPLLMVMFLFGLGQGALDIGANVNILWVYQSRVGPYMNALHFCFGVGAFLSPLVIHQVLRITDGNLVWTFVALAVLSMPGLVGLFILKSPQNPEKNTEDLKNQPTQTKLIFLLILLFFVYVGVEGGFGNWIFTYSTETEIANEGTASLMNSFYWGTLTVGRLISIVLARKLKPSTILLGNFVLSILFLSLILIWPVNPQVIWIGSIGLGFSLSSVFPTLLSLAETRMKITGKVTSLFFLGSSSGGILVPMVLGQIFEYIGSYEIMLTLFGVTTAGLVILLLVISTSNSISIKARS